jgi:hypothetical protein
MYDMWDTFFRLVEVICVEFLLETQIIRYMKITEIIYMNIWRNVFECMVIYNDNVDNMYVSIISIIKYIMFISNDNRDRAYTNY